MIEHLHLEDSCNIFSFIWHFEGNTYIPIYHIQGDSNSDCESETIIKINSPMGPVGWKGSLNEHEGFPQCGSFYFVSL